MPKYADDNGDRDGGDRKGDPGKGERPPLVAALAEDISGVVTALAGVANLTDPIDLHIELAGSLADLVDDVATEVSELATASLKERAESVGAENAAVDDALSPIERLPLENASHSSIIGTLRDHKTGDVISSAARVIARTDDGETVGESEVDGLGGFTIHIESMATNVRVEALDDAEQPIALSTVELGESRSAHFVDLFGTGKSTTSKTHRGNEPQPIRGHLNRDERADSRRRVRFFTVDDEGSDGLSNPNY